MPRDLFVVALVWLTDDVIVKEASAFPAHALPRSGVEDGRVNQLSKGSFLCVPQIPPLADLVFILNQREIHLVCIALFQGTPLCKSSLHEFCGKVSSQNHPAVVVKEIEASGSFGWNVVLLTSFFTRDPPDCDSIFRTQHERQLTRRSLPRTIAQARRQLLGPVDVLHSC